MSAEPWLTCEAECDVCDALARCPEQEQEQERWDCSEWDESAALWSARDEQHDDLWPIRAYPEDGS